MKRSKIEKLKAEGLHTAWTPIKDCSFKDDEDGCCLNDKQFTPECHVFACPRLHLLISKVFEEITE